MWPRAPPSAVTTMAAGCPKTPKRDQIGPRSAMLGNVPMPHSSTAARPSSLGAKPATPMRVKSDFAATSTTVGASALQICQVGAQNQKRVSCPARSAPLMASPPMRVASQSRICGTPVAEVVTGEVVTGEAVAGGVVSGVVVWAPVPQAATARVRLRRAARRAVGRGFRCTS